MYQYNLIISIFSKDEKLEQIIRTITLLGKFTHQIEKYDLFDKKTIANSDIIICDLADEEIEQVMKITKKNAKIILCTNQYFQAFDKMNCIILKPFDYAFLNILLEKYQRKFV